ncbi:MAG: DNA polymerase III subunit delta [Phycisphaerales bacterium]|jgi:DNA polymerase III delta subunit
MAKRTTSKPAKHAAPDGSERVAILKGREAFLRQHYLDKLREALGEATGLEVHTIRFDGESAELADVLDECRSPGLLPVHKLVVVDAADKFVREATRPALEKYAEAPDERATLVLRAETWRPGRLDKAVEKVGKVISCEAVGPQQAAQWATARAKGFHQVNLQADAARLLVDSVGVDLARLDAELGKLATDATGPVDAPEISAELVRTHVRATREAEKPWPLQDEIMSGDPARALAYVELWMGNAPRDQAVPAMWACVDLTRVLAVAARLAQGGTPEGAIAKKLNIWPAHKGGVIVRAAKRLGPAGAARLHQSACEADAAMKRGAPSRRTLERLCVEIASRVSRRPDTP